MNKMQALNAFWNSFGLKAYDSSTVSDTERMPYITYEANDSYFGQILAQTASLWYYSTSWKEITEKELEIAEAIGRGGQYVEYDGGAFIVRRGTPWANRLPGENDMIRRIALNVEIEFID